MNRASIKRDSDGPAEDTDDQHESMANMIELIAFGAPNRARQLKRWLADAAAGDFDER